MWICYCHAVNDGAVRRVIEEGASDETEIGRRCGAGTKCGSCVDELRRICSEHRARSTVGV